MKFSRRIILKTPESVNLEFTLAGIGSRVYALIIDYTLWFLLLAAFVIVGSLLAAQIVDLVVQLGGEDEIGLWLVAIGLLAWFAIYVGYFVAFETLWQGQTPGKRFAKIRVIQDTGRPITVYQATLRSLLRPIDDFLFLGFFLIVLSPKEKRLGDLVAGTIVVQVERPRVTETLRTSDMAKRAASRLLDTLDLSPVLPDDFAIIRDYLQRRSLLTPPANDRLAHQLAAQLKTILGINTLPPGLTDELFLEAIYLAYQHSDRPPAEPEY